MMNLIRVLAIVSAPLIAASAFAGADGQPAEVPISQPAFQPLAAEGPQCVAPAPMACSVFKLRKKCCPDYCKNKGKKKDKEFDACAKDMGCGDYEGKGFTTCKPDCK